MTNRKPFLPWMTLVLTVFSILARFWYEMLTPLQQHIMVSIAGANPAVLAQWFPQGIFDGVYPGAAALVLSLFVHSGWLHLLGNLAYLWVFGFAVEKRLGPVSLAGVFIAGGSLALLVLAMRVPQLNLPVIGSSGAVSAVLGTYLGLFPNKHIGLYLPLGVFVQFVKVPALLVIGSWFVLQLVYSAFGPISGALAWWTHLAGFTLGLIFALLARALALLSRRVA